MAEYKNRMSSIDGNLEEERLNRQDELEARMAAKRRLRQEKSVEKAVTEKVQTAVDVQVSVCVEILRHCFQFLFLPFLPFLLSSLCSCLSQHNFSFLMKTPPFVKQPHFQAFASQTSNHRFSSCLSRQSLFLSSQTRNLGFISNAICKVLFDLT